MNHHRLQLYFFFALLLGLLWLSFLIFRPYLTAVVLAAVFAVIFQPPYKRMLILLRGRSGLAAFFTVVIVTLVIILPLLFFGALVFKEIQQIYGQIIQGGDLSSKVNALLNLAVGLQEKFPDFAVKFSANLSQYLERILAFLFSSLNPIFSGIFQLAVGFFLGLLTLYYFLKDGKKLLQAITKFSPLSDQYDWDIFNKLRIAVDSVIKGNLLVALVQGLLTGIGFAIFGVPSPALWGAVAVVAALIPAVGTGVIIIPAAIYLFAIGNGLFGTGMFVWGAAIVGLVDNLLRPKLIERGIHIHPLLILFSVLGGISIFGVIGFLLGPLILSLLFALLDIYPILVNKTEKS